MTESFDRLREAEHLLTAAERDSSKAADAARAALRSLLEAWSVQPRGDAIAQLLSQAAETDDTLSQFRADAEALDGSDRPSDAYDRAKVFVDAARARLANI